MSGKTKKAAGPAKKGRPSRPVNTETFAGRLGAAIRARREELGMTLDDAEAAACGLVSASLWGSYEGGVEPGVRRYVAVCLALGVGPTDLLPKDVCALFGSRLTGAKADLLAKG